MPVQTRGGTARFRGPVPRPAAGLQLGFFGSVLIAVLTFDVRPDKRRELVQSVTGIVQTIRWSTGCLDCRLLSDCENPYLISVVSEWDSRSCLDQFLASPEFRILEGTRFLLRGGPSLSIDEVIARGRHPGPIRPLV